MILELNQPEQSRLLDTLVTHMKTERENPAHRPNHWQDFFQKLKPLGLTGPKRDAFAFWATSQSKKAKRGQPKVRLLHPTEAAFITPDAYGYLLELCHIGVLHSEDFDTLIEEVTENPNLPMNQEQIKNWVIQFLARFFSNYSPTVSH